MNVTALPFTATDNYTTSPPPTLEYVNSLPIYAVVSQVIIISACFFIGIFGNTITVYAVVRFPYLRNSTNIFIVNLAIAGFLVCALIMPMFMISLLHERWPWPETLCILVGMVTIIFFEVSLLTHLCIAVNRYIIIMKRRIITQKIFTQRNTVLICIGVWTTAVLLSLPPLFSWGSYEFNSAVHMCLLKQPESLAFSWFICITCAFIPTIIIVICYLRIYVHVKASSQRLKNNESITRIAYEVSANQSVLETEKGDEDSNDSVFEDQIHIDVKHTYTGTANDYYESTPKKGSCVSFHDDKTKNNLISKCCRDKYLTSVSEDKETEETPVLSSTPEKSPEIEIIITESENVKTFTNSRDSTMLDISKAEISTSDTSSCVLQPMLTPSQYTKSANAKLENSKNNNKKYYSRGRRSSCLNNSQASNCSKETKVAVNLFIIFALFCLLWFPWGVMLLLTIFVDPPKQYFIVTILIYFLTPSLNCIFYCCRNNNFKTAFKQMLCCKK